MYHVKCTSPGFVSFLSFIYNLITSNAEKIFCGELTGDADHLFSLLRNLLGNRKGCGKRLDDLCPHFKLFCQITSPFQSSIGCRYGHFYSNSIGLIEYYDELVHMLDQTKKTLTNNQKDFECILTSASWSTLKLEMGLPMLGWLYLLDQHHKAVSSRSTFVNVKMAMNDLEDRANRIINGTETVTAVVEKLLGQEFQVSERAEKALR